MHDARDTIDETGPADEVELEDETRYHDTGRS